MPRYHKGYRGHSLMEQSQYSAYSPRGRLFASNIEALQLLSMKYNFATAVQQQQFSSGVAKPVKISTLDPRRHGRRFANNFVQQFSGLGSVLQQSDCRVGNQSQSLSERCVEMPPTSISAISDWQSVPDVSKLPVDRTATHGQMEEKAKLIDSDIEKFLDVDRYSVADTFITNEDPENYKCLSDMLQSKNSTQNSGCKDGIPTVNKSCDHIKQVPLFPGNSETSQGHERMGTEDQAFHSFNKDNEDSLSESLQSWCMSTASNIQPVQPCSSDFSSIEMQNSSKSGSEHAAVDYGDIYGLDVSGNLQLYSFKQNSQGPEKSIPLFPAHALSRDDEDKFGLDEIMYHLTADLVWEGDAADNLQRQSDPSKKNHEDIRGNTCETLGMIQLCGGSTFNNSERSIRNLSQPSEFAGLVENDTISEIQAVSKELLLDKVNNVSHNCMTEINKDNKNSEKRMELDADLMRWILSQEDKIHEEGNYSLIEKILIETENRHATQTYGNCSLCNEKQSSTKSSNRSAEKGSKKSISHTRQKVRITDVLLLEAKKFIGSDILTGLNRTKLETSTKRSSRLLLKQLKATPRKAERKIIQKIKQPCISKRKGTRRKGKERQLNNDHGSDLVKETCEKAAIAREENRESSIITDFSVKTYPCKDIKSQTEQLLPQIRIPERQLKKERQLNNGHGSDLVKDLVKETFKSKDLVKDTFKSKDLVKETFKSNVSEHNEKIRGTPHQETMKKIRTKLVFSREEFEKSKEERRLKRCVYCGKMNREVLHKIHINKYHPHHCAQCQKDFQSKKFKLEHYLQAHVQQTYPCAPCDRKFFLKSVLERHLTSAAHRHRISDILLVKKMFSRSKVFQLATMDPHSRQGYLGNLQNKTNDELRDLLQRQEKLLRKRSFLSTLSDKGSKVQQFAKTLVDMIEEREKMAAQLQPMDFMLEKTSGSSSASSNVLEVSKFGSSKVVKQEDTISGLVIEHFSDSQDLEDVDSKPGNDLTSYDDLEQNCENLSMKEKSSEHSKDIVHLYDIAEERAKHNALKQKKEHFKPNSTLKISKIDDLPPKFRHPQLHNSAKGNIGDQTMEINKAESGNECRDGSSNRQDHYLESSLEGGDSSVTPQKNIFKKVKIITLQESVQLQREHKAKQEVCICLGTKFY